MLTKWDAGSLLFARVIPVQRRDGPGRLSDYGDDDDDDDDDLCVFLIVVKGKCKWSSDPSCPVIFLLNIMYELLLKYRMHVTNTTLSSQLAKSYSFIFYAVLHNPYSFLGTY